MKEWAKCAGVRAIKTVAQTAVATIGTAADIRCSKFDYGYICINTCRGTVNINKCSWIA